MLAPWIAPSLSASIALGGFGLSLSPGVEAGVQVGRLYPFAGARWSAPHATGEEEGFTWGARVDIVRLEVGAHARILPDSEPISPIVGLAIGPALTVARTQGEMAGETFPATHETRMAPAGRLDVGLGGKLGAGTLEGYVDFSATGMSGSLTGKTVLFEITPGVSWRVSL